MGVHVTVDVEIAQPAGPVPGRFRADWWDDMFASYRLGGDGLLMRSVTERRGRPESDCGKPGSLLHALSAHRMETVGWKSVDLTGFLTVECDEDGRRGEVWTFRFEGGRSTGVRPGCAGAWAVADADAAAVLRRVRKMLEPGREAPYGDLRAVLDAACGPDQAP